MRKIVAWLFMSLDGVVESPEKWVMFNDELGDAVDAEAAAADTLLLGARTYELFAAFWPQRTVEDDPHADWMNNTPKLVASSTRKSLEWNNSTLIRGNVANELARAKQESGKNLLINGSPTLVRSLLRADLLDELRLFVHPVVVNRGARLFENMGEGVSLTLSDSQAYSTGVVSLTYRPSGG